MKVCVYCASSAQIDKKYFEATEQVAIEMVRAGIDVVYGGGAVGLMGKLADTVLAHGGRIKGIIPKFMNEVEWAHKQVQEMVLVDTMHERKAKFLENIDALITLPGGSGTLEELLEAITLKRLGLLTCPIIILNLDGYYNPLRNMLEKCVEERFMSSKHLEMWTFVDTPQEILPAIQNAAAWTSGAINFAVNR
jgi:uncharacterized protein (TIGR00730 family)